MGFRISFNSFKRVIETRHSPWSRIWRTSTFAARLNDVFWIVAGNKTRPIIVSEDIHYEGRDWSPVYRVALSDYLLLAIPQLIDLSFNKLWIIFDSHDPDLHDTHPIIRWLVFFFLILPLGIIHCTFRLFNFIMAAAITLLASPIAWGVHCYYKHQPIFDKDNSINQNSAQYLKAVAIGVTGNLNSYYPLCTTHHKTLGNVLQSTTQRTNSNNISNLNDLDFDEFDRLTYSRFFRRPIIHDKTETAMANLRTVQGIGQLLLTPRDHGSAHFEVDLELQIHSNSQSFKAMLKLNVAGSLTALEESRLFEEDGGKMIEQFLATL